jgi:hypothetical protein
MRTPSQEAIWLEDEWQVSDTLHWSLNKPFGVILNLTVYDALLKHKYLSRFVCTRAILQYAQGVFSEKVKWNHTEPQQGARRYAISSTNLSFIWKWLIEKHSRRMVFIRGSTCCVHLKPKLTPPSKHSSFYNLRQLKKKISRREIEVLYFSSFNYLYRNLNFTRRGRLQTLK